MTPYQLSLCINDYNERKKAEEEEKLTLVWLGAYWQRVKQMPSLNSLLGKNQEKKVMTPEQILEQVKKLNESLGGRVY